MSSSRWLRAMPLPLLLSIMCVTLGSAHNSDNPTIYPAPSGPACDWRPVQVSKPAGVQCGFNDIGAPNPGIFECGIVSNGKACVDHCVFVKCQEI